MEIFITLTKKIGELVPEWVPFIVVPAAILLLAVIFTVFGGRKAYMPSCFAVGGAGAFITGCMSDSYTAFLYAALLAAYSGLWGLLFLAPCPFSKEKKRKRAEKRQKRDEEIYARFRADLQPAEDTEAEGGDEPLATAEECGTCLAHVGTLLSKLRKEKLSPADRLQTEALSRTVEGYRGRPLSEKELHLVNDCLATVLKLTAKYKL